jgi:hypothetical protein
VAKTTVQSLQASLSTLETHHTVELEQLRHQLQNALRENTTLKRSIKNLEVSAAQHVKELSNQISYLESTSSSSKALLDITNTTTTTNEKATISQQPLSTNSGDLQSQSSEEHAIIEFKTCLDVVYSQLSASETLLSLERKASESLQESLSAAKAKHSSEVAQLRMSLQETQNENKSLHESRKEMKSSAVHHMEILSNKIHCLEKASERAVGKMETRLKFITHQLSSLKKSTDVKERDNECLQSALKRLQGECASLQSDNKIIKNELQSYRDALLNKENDIAKLESLLSSQQSGEMLQFQELRSSEVNEKQVGTRIAISTKGSKFRTVIKKPKDFEKKVEDNEMIVQDNSDNGVELHQSINKWPENKDSEIPGLGQQATLLNLQQSNEFLRQELLNKDIFIEQLINIKDGLERDLQSVKSLLEVAQKEVFMFCEMLLQSQRHHCDSPLDSLVVT